MANFRESFNTANSTTLGPDLAWTEVNDDSQVLNNAWSPVTVGGALFTAARANQDLGTVNHYAQCTIPSLTVGASGNPDIGVMVRFSSSALTGYSFNVLRNAAVPNGFWQLESVVAGVETVLQGQNYTWAAGDVLYLSVQGSTVTARINGVQVATVTNATFPGNTQAGLVGYRAVAGDVAGGDDFQMGDFLEAVVGPTFAPPWGTGHPAAQPPGIDLTDYEVDVVAPDYVGGPIDLGTGSGWAASAGLADLNLTADVRGHGDAAAAGKADLGLTADVRGHGDAASGSKAPLNLTADLRGHGDAAASSPTAPLNLTADLRGHGDAASAGKAADLPITASLAGRGAAASAGRADITAAITITGHGDASSAGRADLGLTADLRGHGDAAAGSTAALLATLSLSGHGDSSSAGTANITNSLALAGHGDASSAGKADLSVSSVGGNAIALAGTGAAASAGRADLNITASIAGRGAAAAGSTARVDLTASLSGHGDAASAGTATVTYDKGLYGAGAAASGGQASLTVAVSLSGHGDASSGGSGTVQITVSLAGRGAASSAGRASFPVAVVVTADADSYSGARRNRILVINVRWVYPCRVKTHCEFVARRNTRCEHRLRTRLDLATTRTHRLVAGSVYQTRTLTLADRLQDDMDAILAVLGAREET